MKEIEEHLIEEEKEEEKRENEDKDNLEENIINDSLEKEKISENIDSEKEKTIEKDGKNAEKEEDNKKIDIKSDEEEDEEALENVENLEKNLSNKESDKNMIKYSYSDVNLFASIKHSNTIEENNVKINKFLEDDVNEFGDINPLRIRNPSIKIVEAPEDKIKIKKLAIKELVTNLKTQYILFNAKDFIRHYQIKANPLINSKLYKSIRILRNFFLYFYGVVMLFERPWFCYDGTTIPLPGWYTFIENCDEKIEFMSIPFLNNNLLRVIEIIQIIFIIITQILKYKDEYKIRKANVGINKSYNIIQIILFSSLFLSLVDLIVSLCIKKFPIVNFILRPFNYIYMIRRLRMNWINILKVIYKTKNAYFVLFLNMITFGVIGYIFFRKDKGFFESIVESILQLYILLSTCNFPDIMLEAMTFSKFAIIYFVVYISINIFILLSYLKTLYTTKYYEVNKNDCLDIIKNVINNKHNKHIYYGKQFNEFILKQKALYKLSEEEYNNLLILFNLYDNYSDTFNKLTRITEKLNEREIMSKVKYGDYILKSKKVEMIVTTICIICTAALFFKNIFALIFQFLVSLCLFYEPYILIKSLGINRFFKHHGNRVIFLIFNLFVLIYVIYLFIIFKDKDKEQEQFHNVYKIFEIFVSLRTIRLFVFLDKFRIIKNIYIIIRVSKEMLYRNLLLLYSFFLLFSTISMLLTGGNIHKKAFDNNKESIPKEYVYINFNDFASSYIACFCLMMINNLNILVKSLTYQSRHKMFFQFYFATFYFLSTLILINIIQTLLLEMYLISDHSLSDEDKKNKKPDDIQENKEEDIINNDVIPIDKNDKIV